MTQVPLTQSSLLPDPFHSRYLRGGSPSTGGEEPHTSTSILHEGIQKMLLEGKLLDLTLKCGGVAKRTNGSDQEVACHRTILAAASPLLASKLEDKSVQELNLKELLGRAVNPGVVAQLVRFLYFLPVQTEVLGPEAAVDLLRVATELKIEAVREEEIMPLVSPRLTASSGLQLLLNQDLDQYPSVLHAVCEYMSGHFMEVLSKDEKLFDTLTEELPKPTVYRMIPQVIDKLTDDVQVESLITFLQKWAQLSSAIDLLRICKTWPWFDPSQMNLAPDGTPGLATFLDPSVASSGGYAPLAFDWHIPDLRAALGLDSDVEGEREYPKILIEGKHFNWQATLDINPEGFLRILFLQPLDKPDRGPPLAVRRFPAAQVAWTLNFRGQPVYNDTRPVFICYARDMPLMWSVNTGIAIRSLNEGEPLTLRAHLHESSAVSMILHHFSTDLSSKINLDEMLNILPSIEYRCLSAYQLFARQ